MIITEHLEALNFMFHLSCHDSRDVRSACKESVCISFSTSLYTNQSSANSLVWLFSRSGRSLIYIRNSNSPSTVPWGTPDRTLLYCNNDNNNIVNINNVPCLLKMTLLAQLCENCITVGIQPSSDSRKKVIYT